MKVIFFNRFFFPDNSATSQMLSDLAFHLAGHGTQVHVVTSGVESAHDDERVRDVHVHRVAMAAPRTQSLGRRALAYAVYYVAARRCARSLIARGDLVVLKTDPPFLAPAMMPLAKARGAKVVIWLQDLFPEVARAYGVPGFKGPVYSLLRFARDRALGQADAVVAIADSMAAQIRHLVPPERLHIIHNWANGAALRAHIDGGKDIRIEWGLRHDQFVVAYSGNFGRVHEFETILRAAGQLRHEDIAFMLVGDGPQHAAVRERVAHDQLENVRFARPQPRERLAAALGAADVHLNVLRPEFEGLVHPSKLYGIMAVGRPTIFVGDVTGETARILEQTGAGVSVATGDADALAAAIRRMRADPAERERMCERGRRTFDGHYDMPIAFSRWEALLLSALAQ